MTSRLSNLGSVARRTAAGTLWGLLAVGALLFGPGVDAAHAQDGDEDGEELGEEVYEAACIGCHKDEGRGVEGMFPSLRQNALIQGPPEPLLLIVLEGRAAMPGFGERLSDKQIAAVLTYLRSEWGNDAGRIEAHQIARMRKHLAATGTGDPLGR